MEIISQSIYTIDHKNNNVLPRDIPEHFMEYIHDLISFIEVNPNIRNYKVRSESTQVVVNIKKIISEINQEYVDESSISSNNKEIAGRLLLKEIEVQTRIEHMKTKIKKGSIIQVLLKDEDTNRYQYLIAKVDHHDFIDDNDLCRKIGFSAKNKDIGKTCIIETTSLDDGDVSIDNAKIYLDSPAKYWADEFLEFEEMRDDESNTIMVFKQVEGVLTRQIKPKSPSDFIVLRNSLIGKFRSGESINYYDMIDELLVQYKPENKESLNSSVISHVVTVLRELPQKRHFDSQFTPIPSAIKAKIKRSYPVRTGIEIKIDNYVEDIKKVISSWEDAQGNRYIRIEVTNSETFALFM